jgi:3-deoxy-D-manno-octulosonic acid (KDO) 8-phosphate synthase
MIYKSSYDKANRTSAGAARGIGMAAGWKFWPGAGAFRHAGADRCA